MYDRHVDEREVSELFNAQGLTGRPGFPKPVDLHPWAAGRVAKKWRLSEVREWVQAHRSELPPSVQVP